MKNITYYQMANRSDEEVKSQFVVRQNEYEQVISEVERDTMKGSIQHYVFVGQRGSGKSTLLRRIQAEVNTDAKMSKKLIAVNLSEEQAGIYRLHDLWDRVGQELENQNISVEKVPWENFGTDMTGYAKALYFALQKALKKEKKKLVLLLDNIDRIFETIKQDQHLFRELLMNHKDVRIIGGSTRLSEHHWKYDAPFYEFFSVIRLDSLTREELKELLLFWGEFFEEPSLKIFVEKHPGKLEAIRILSDGMPRTMLHLIELLIHEPEKHGYDYLQQIVDRATPIYQERLGTLSPSHQKVLLELSFFWDAIKVKELVSAVKMESKTVSAMLKQLVDLQIVEKVEGQGRNHFYRLKERFFNLWLVMTQGGPRQKSQVKWLTIFLETWYDEEELREYYGRVRDGLDTMEPNHAILMTKALVHSRFISIEERDELIDRVQSIVEIQDYSGFIPKQARIIYKEASFCFRNKELDKALELLNTIEQPDGYKYLLIGLIFLSKEVFTEAESALLKAVAKDTPAAYKLLGLLYERNGFIDLAEESYLNTIGHSIIDVNVDIAEFYQKQNRGDKAEEFFLKALDANEEGAEFKIAYFYETQEKKLEAEFFYKKAIDLGDDIAAYNLGLIKAKESDYGLAQKYFTIAIDRGYSKAYYDLLAIYYFEKEKENAEELIETIKESEVTALEDEALIQIVSLWLGILPDVKNFSVLIKKLLENDNSNIINFFLIHLLIHYQEVIVRDLFRSRDFGYNLKLIMKPLYYVSILLADRKNELQVKMTFPPELDQAISELYGSVLEERAYFL